jgi:predicted ATPase/DNA-binding CsgD family transcriptional regulator
MPLGDIPDAELIIEATAAALGLHDRDSRLDRGQLVEYLQPRELLLVLDNCEHVIEESASLVADLLAACPRLHVLATSREALRVDGESLHRVGPLSVPAADNPDAGTEFEAVRLLVDRAGKAVSEFIIADQDRRALVDICRHLDGVPLALELAAVRLRAVSPADLVDELRTHWEFLDVGTRGAPDRHRTMSACLNWSYSLCTPEERELWALLSVFRGGMSMDAIHAVATHTEALANRQRMLQVIQQLVDKSIVMMQIEGGKARYSMLDVLSRFGRSRLEEQGLLEATLLRHRDWYAVLVRQLHEMWMSPQQTALLSELRRDEANLRVALTYCLSRPGEAGVGLEMVAQLRKYAVAHGLFSEGRRWLQKLLAGHTEGDLTRLMGLRAGCWLAALQGDTEATEGLLAECQQLAEQLGESAQVLVDQVTGLCAMVRGDLQAAVDHLERALDAFRNEPHAQRQAETLILLSMANDFAGNLAVSARLHEECQRVCTTLGETWYLSYSLWHGGLVAWREGDVARALSVEREGLRLKQVMGERFGIALCLEAIAWMTATTAPGTSATLLGTAHALWGEMATSVATVAGLLPHHQKCREELLQALTESAFNQALANGARMELEDAISLALGRPSTHPQRSAPAIGEGATGILTNRQRQIADLVAAGLTNKEIANALVISTRTAETHVENILTKLGFTSRTQLAVWVSQHQTGSTTP